MKNNQKGITHLLIIVAIAVVGLIGFLIWTFTQNSKTVESGVVDKSKVSQQVIDDCAKAINDKDVCRFFATWGGVGKFEAVLSSTIEGVTTTSTTKIDGSNNYIKVDGEYPMEIITIGSTTYTKAGDFWWKKTNKSATTTNDSDLYSVDTNDYKFDEPTSATVDTTKYNNLGKEVCGNLTCFKYQIVDSSDTDTTGQYIWFDDVNYLMRKMRSESRDGSISEQTLSYDNVSVTAPTNVKDLADNQYIIPGSSEPMTMPDYNDLIEE